MYGRSDEVEIRSALSAEEAFEACRRHRPDLVLMDLQMPVLDGIRATRILHQEYGESAFDIIAVSAMTGSETGNLPGLDLFDGYVAKPVSFDALRLQLHAVATRNGQTAADRAGQTDRPIPRSA